MGVKNVVPQSIKNLYHGLVAGVSVIVSGNPAAGLTVIGVTGTDGKTTTSSLIYHVLKTAGLKVALISTVAAYIGDEQIDTGFHVTSPSPWQLQQLLKKIKDMGFTHVVLECTSHGFDQHRLLGTNITYAVLTNVTPEHLDYHLTFNRYLQTKAKIFKNAKVAILNQDDASFAALKAKIPTSCTLHPYSLSNFKGFESAITSRFEESFNQQNALAVCSLATILKIEKKIIEVALASFPGVPGRMEVIPNQRELLVVVDFAHTPNALKNALQALKSRSKGRLIAVYGAAGLRDPYKRPDMGKWGSELADEVVLTAEDPRSEPVACILHQLKEGVKNNHGHVHAIRDRFEAINFAVNTLAKNGDTVAIFGKGHERSMNLDGKHEKPWSDQEAVKAALYNNSSPFTHS